MTSTRAAIDRTAISKYLAPLDWWGQKCHAASLELVRSALLPSSARVARGTARGVGGQHSWVVVDGDCYDPRARIIDPTLWSYVDEVSGIWYGRASEGIHRPHQAGSIWAYGKPAPAEGPVIELTPKSPLSAPAQMFLQMVGPLDRRGWAILANSPVEDWPAAEIIAAMDDTRELTALVPIDALGMLTDRNPGGLYR